MAKLYKEISLILLLYLAVVAVLGGGGGCSACILDTVAIAEGNTMA